MIEQSITPLEPPQVDKLRTLFDSPEYTLLREVLAARGCQEAVQFANAALYDTQVAKDTAEIARVRAAAYSTVLDVLDAIQQDGQWFRIKLELRR